MFTRLWAVCTAFLLLHTTAWALPHAITAPLSDGTSKWAQQTEVRDTLAEALKGVPDVDSVHVIDIAPASLTKSCLDDDRCLERVMIESEAPALITGIMGVTGETYKLDLVYFARGMTVRRLQFTVPADADGLRVAARALTWELVTGEKAPADVLAAASEPPPRPKKTKEPKEPKTKRERPERTAKAPRERTPRERTAREPRVRTTAAAPKPPKQPKAPRSASGSSDAPRLRITPRVGWSRYYTFDFVTVGAEAGLRLTGGLHLVGGVEVYAVNRDVPSAVDPDGGKVWNAMTPLNLGALYQARLGKVQPYVGLDAIIAKYNRDASGIAMGGRARVGTDVMVSDQMGINLNVAFGGWTGETWDRVHDSLGNTGILPQVSAGTVFTF